MTRPPRRRRGYPAVLRSPIRPSWVIIGHTGSHAWLPWCLPVLRGARSAHPVRGRASYDPRVSTPVLATKLFAPTRRQQLVVRPRLLGQLDTTLAPSHRPTVPPARAGFGRTTLLTDWLSTLEIGRAHA